VLGLLAAISRSPALTHALARVLGGATPVAAQQRQVFGLTFPNPIGLAAGLDKDASAVPALAALGFGFLELGTVTRDAQPGNPRPRLFRLPADAALINRMGFNNAGAARMAARLAALPRVGIPLGISLGKSRATPLDAAVEDYLASLTALEPYADYFAINVSSPNTPGLRDLQERDRLDALLVELVARLRELAAQSGRAHPRPLLLKVAPDLEDGELASIAEVCLARGVDGLIATNTTLSREGLSSPCAERGGLSGPPLHARAVRVVQRLRALVGDRLPIVGCGGIATASDAQRFFDAGATLVQLYTAFVYQGPGLARRLVRDLARG
jgi:dihydroorotate dehydrogenase